ncbi:MAG TPA: PEGA domain-containing protein [Vicinamibacterales bacterium]|nr:PEGA domain-containing protein [Vicinamibacterales bacterium]
MNEEGAPFDSGFDDTGPFRVSPVSGSVSLEVALRDFGPAAIDDLIARVRELAATLDRAHAAGAIHGALHPRNIFVTDTASDIVVDDRPSAPYAAPEVLGGGAATPLSDQFSLAAITHEWMTSRPIGGPADRPIDVRAIPGVDRAAISQALTRALAREPGRRFASCSAFRDALVAAVASTLPLGADDDDPIEPFLPETPGDGADMAIAPTNGHAAASVDLDDFRIMEADGIDEPAIGDRGSGVSDQGAGIGHQGAGIGDQAAALRDLGADLDEPEDAPVPVRAWEPSVSPSQASVSPRFGGFALILALLVGAVFGFAAGYMARPRALQTAPIAEGLAPAPAAEQRREAEPVPPTPAPPVAVAPATKAPEAKTPTPVSPGRLLVRSTPSGASVSVDGTPRGETPLTLRELPLGTREVVVSEPGHLPESRRVALTESRPSRSIEVRLSRASSASPPGTAAPRPSTPATRPAASTGELVVESLPSGATVSVNGQPQGTTPLSLAELPPGEYRVTMSMQGYREFATTVRVVAGERARAAARLTVQEQE